MFSFVPDPALLAAYLVGVFIIVITPGPDMTFFLTRTVAQGVAAGMAAMTGALFGLLVHSTLVAFGLSALIVASPGLFLAVKLAGAVYLLWLAFDAIRNGSAVNALGGEIRKRPIRRIWMQGLAINLMNPKIILFFLTFLPQFVSPADPHAPGKLLFLGGLFVVVTIPLTVPMILAAGKLTNFLKRSPKVTRVVDYLFASIFGAFALRILLVERH